MRAVINRFNLGWQIAAVVLAILVATTFAFLALGASVSDTINQHYHPEIPLRTIFGHSLTVWTYGTACLLIGAFVAVAVYLIIFDRHRMYGEVSR